MTQNEEKAELKSTTPEETSPEEVEMEVKSPVAEENEAEIPADNASGQKAEETTAKSEPLPDVEKAEAAPLPTLSTMDFLNVCF